MIRYEISLGRRALGFTGLDMESEGNQRTKDDFWVIWLRNCVVVPLTEARGRQGGAEVGGGLQIKSSISDSSSFQDHTGA